MRLSYENLFLYFFKNHISILEASKKSGVSRNTFMKMKNNEPVHLNVILAICEAYDLDIFDVIKTVEEKQ